MLIVRFCFQRCGFEAFLVCKVLKFQFFLIQSVKL